MGLEKTILKFIGNQKKSRRRAKEILSKKSKMVHITILDLKFYHRVPVKRDRNRHEDQWNIIEITLQAFNFLILRKHAKNTLEER